MINYTVTVENTGNQTITDIVVKDSMKDKITLTNGSSWDIATLAPGEHVDITGTYTVTDDDVLAGKVINVAGVESAKDPEGKDPDVNDDDGTKEDPTVIPTEIAFKGTKTLSGRTMTAGEFSFTLSDDNGEVETVKNAADGSYGFTVLKIYKVGTYTYTVKENDTKKNGVTYDTKVYTITVTVDRDSSGNLTAVMAGDSTTGTDLNFENVYKVGSLTVSKTVTGNLGDKNQFFPFTITFGDSGSYSYVGSTSGTITSGGTIQLKHGQSITINDLPVGISYRVVESDYSGYTMTSTGESGTITADKTVKASFTNNKSSGPSTGDQNDPLFWTGMLAASMAGALGTALTGKKKRRHADR